MPTIIDSLLVKLGLESSDFKKGMTQVDSSLKSTEKSVASVSQSMTKFLALIGGTYAIQHFVEQTINSSAALNRLSKNLDVSVSSITAWGNATEMFGGSAAGFQSTLTMLSRARTQFELTGNNSLVPFFSQLHINPRDTGIGQLLALSDKMQNFSRDKANNILMMMGIDQGTANAMLGGRKELELMLKRQKEYGDTLGKFAPTGEKFYKMLVELKQSFTLLGIELLSRAAPAIEWSLNLFIRFGEWSRQHKPFIEAFLGMLSAGLVAISISMLPISLTVAAILGLVAALALVWEDYQKWAEGGNALMPWDKWIPGIKKAIDWLSELAKWMPQSDAGTPEKPGEGNWLKWLAPSDAGAADTMDYLEKRDGLPKGTLNSVWSAESGRGKHMKSPAGAEGHFQFMPGTARQYGLSNPYDFNESADAASRYLRDLRMHYGGDMSKAIAAYNAGPGRIDRTGIAGAPAETRGYLKKVLGGIPGASLSAAGVGAGVSSGASGFSVPGSNSVETSIGAVNVFTQATDAEGIAKDMKRALDYTFSAQANYGLQ